MRKAFCVGIENYKNDPLSGCVNDASSIGKALEKHYDGSANFEVKYLRAPRWESKPISAAELAGAIDELFDQEDLEIALFFYSGHGAFDGKQGYLCASETGGYVPMEKLIEAAVRSGAQNKIIILDCCHSGATGVQYFSQKISGLPEDTVIMAGCTKEGSSLEVNGSGIFTQLFLEALNGADANALGVVTPGSIYSYIDKALGTFDGQRPVFKANVKSSICLKRNKPPIDLEQLKLITLYFPNPGFVFPLDPSFEEDKNYVPEGQSRERNMEHEAVFKILRKYWQNGLIVPVDLPEDKEYMYWAAVLSTGCKLTALGRHYWVMLQNGAI